MSAAIILKDRVYEILEVAGEDDRASRAVDVFILALIALNVVAMIFETVEPIRRAAPLIFQMFETFSVVIFSVEYLARLWSCTVSPEFRRPVVGRLRFALTPLALIDLIAILPFYLPLLGVDLRSMRVLRIFRLLRVAKLARYSVALRALGRAIASRKEELVTIVGLILVLVVLTSSLMYFVEHEAQPEHFSSIPAAMWWAVVTFTTVGYGDIYPITPAGKILGGLTVILGIGVLALPTGVLGSAFMDEIERRRRGPALCPHCGRNLESAAERPPRECGAGDSGAAP